MKRINITIDDETQRLLDYFVKEKGMTQSSAIRVAIAQMMKEPTDSLSPAREDGLIGVPGPDPYEDTAWLEAERKRKADRAARIDTMPEEHKEYSSGTFLPPEANHVAGQNYDPYLDPYIDHVPND